VWVIEEADLKPPRIEFRHHIEAKAGPGVADITGPAVGE
jgi:hypothetical protein